MYLIATGYFYQAPIRHFNGCSVPDPPDDYEPVDEDDDEEDDENAEWD